MKTASTNDIMINYPTFFLNDQTVNVYLTSASSSS